MLSDRKKAGIFLMLTVLFIGYTAWLYAHLPANPYQLSPVAEKGKMLWQQQNCGACHQVYGLGGYLGPDLTNVFSKRGPGYIGAFIKGGTQIMPRFDLTDDEVNALVSYLEHVDASGSGDPRSFKINRDGTIQH